MARNEHVSARLAVAQASPKLLALACALALIWCYCTFPKAAQAEEIDTDPTPDELQLEIERTAAELEEANAQVEATEAEIKEKTARIAELEVLIPAQQARSEAAARELYKFEQETPGIVELLLSSDSFFDFLTNLDYVNRISQANVDEINRLHEMKTELDASTAELEQAKADAITRANEADKALTAAQEARLEAQRKAQEAARQEAEAAAAAAAAAASSQNKSEDSDDSDDSDDAPAAATSSGSSAPTPIEDGADWSEDEATFIANWAPRIDAYLSGSPLSGYGTAFAKAAWEYGVDPRWSPAISFTESSKGEYCFLPHNAWGWGSVSWDSWEEAINDHVRGLARGYGYTISMEAAQKYCPPNAEVWYERTLGQMNQI